MSYSQKKLASVLLKENKNRRKQMETKQEKLLAQYKNLMGHMTYKQISADTGIQFTRVFRLFNGAEMKHSEYELFKAKIIQMGQARSEFQALLETCVTELSDSDVLKVQDYIKKLMTKKSILDA